MVSFQGKDIIREYGCGCDMIFFISSSLFTYAQINGSKNPYRPIHHVWPWVNIPCLKNHTITCDGREYKWLMVKSIFFKSWARWLPGTRAQDEATLTILKCMSSSWNQSGLIVIWNEIRCIIEEKTCFDISI